VVGLPDVSGGEGLLVGADGDRAAAAAGVRCARSGHLARTASKEAVPPPARAAWIAAVFPAG
jgi:hypothetical protein